MLTKLLKIMDFSIVLYKLAQYMDKSKIKILTYFILKYYFQKC